MTLNRLTIALLATAALAAPALAQTAAGGSGAQGAAGQFITDQAANQWRGSKLVGLKIYGSDNQAIGDVNEILVDDQGTVAAVVIGVGGFLGVGEKDVAVPFRAIQWRDVAPTATSAIPTNRDPNAGRSGLGSSNEGRSSGDAAVMSGGIPRHPVLAMTQDQLKNAPAFNYLGRSQGGPPATTPNTSSNRLNAPRP
jgi:sporulation protein YlmC with PRC-barrel domain